MAQRSKVKSCPFSLTDGQREVPTHKRREGRIAQEGSGEGDGGGGGGRGERRKQNAGDALDPVVAHLVLVPPAEPSSCRAPGVAAAVDAVQREAEVGAKVRGSYPDIIQPTTQD